MTDKEKYDFIDHVVHLTLFEEDRLLNEHGGDYSRLKEDGIDSNEYYRIITERVINTLKKNNYMQEESVSEELEKAANKYAIESYPDEPSTGQFGTGEYESYVNMSGQRECAVEDFKAGAEWQKNHLWKSAEGPDLPIINREVIALLDNGKVVFAHRPPEYWDGKNIITGKVTRNYPKTYDKGGWNIPDVKFWLDVELPKEIEL